MRLCIEDDHWLIASVSVPPFLPNSVCIHDNTAKSSSALVLYWIQTEKPKNAGGLGTRL